MCSNMLINSDARDGIFTFYGKFLQLKGLESFVSLPQTVMVSLTLSSKSLELIEYQKGNY